MIPATTKAQCDIFCSFQQLKDIILSIVVEFFFFFFHLQHRADTQLYELDAQRDPV